MQHKFIRELVEFKFKAIRTATKKAKLFIEYDNSMVWIPNYMIHKFSWDKEKEEVRVLCPSKHFVTIMNQQRHKYKYKRHDKNKFKT
jgi:hypothetical protein